MREYVVCLKKGVDYDAFWNQIENDNSEDGFLPSRRVEIVNNRDGSLRSCHYALSDDEAEQLRLDDRVYCVEIPPDQRTDIEIALTTTQTGNFTKTTSSSGNFLNWGLIRNSNANNVYGTGTTTTLDYIYTANGAGIDIVIHDSGIQVDHPEFTDASGNTRSQQINWYTASGLSGTQSANHYRDYDGHGTHVAGTATGKTYGWAKEAKIFSLKVNGLEGPGDSGTGIPISDCFDVVKLWHRNKPIDPTLGRKRPTIVNMSWGYLTTFANINGGLYRGTVWSGSTKQTIYGMIGDAANRHPVRISSVDVDLEELIDEGVVVCVAAGNQYTKIDVASGLDYNNYYNKTGTGQVYYHRGMSPYSTKAIIVGSMDSTVFDANTDQKSDFSNAGPGIDIFAAGSDIMSALSNISIYSGQTYYANPSYRQVNISGTSMASPQVCGIGALFLESNLTATPAQVKNWLTSVATPTIYSTGLDDDYTNVRSQYGGVTNVAYSANTAGSSVNPTVGVSFFRGFDGKATNLTLKRVPPRLSSSFVNYGFENGITTWKIKSEQIQFKSNPMSRPASLIAGYPTPIDPTPNIYGSPGQTVAVPSNFFTFELVNDVPPSGESQCLKLILNEFIPIQSFGLVYGPAVYSDFAVPCATGDVISFYWKALTGGDAYNVYAYMVNQDTGSYIEILDSTGTNSTSGTSWTQVTKTITSGEQGNYSFVFIAGSYDSTGGQLIGGSLLIDNITITKA